MVHLRIMQISVRTLRLIFRYYYQLYEVVKYMQMKHVKMCPFTFLDATTHLYKLVWLSVRPLVRFTPFVKSWKWRVLRVEFSHSRLLQSHLLVVYPALFSVSSSISACLVTTSYVGLDVQISLPQQLGYLHFPRLYDERDSE